MTYLLQQIFWYVLVAFVIGALIGWWMAGRAAARRAAELEQRLRDMTGERDDLLRRIADLEARLAACEAEAASHAHPPAGTDVEAIEGIGKGYGRRLKEHGIHTVEQLLETCATDEGVERVRAATDEDTHVVHTWAIMADLMRIRGLGGQWSEILWRSGVIGVPDLATRDATTLLAHMHEVNEEEHRVHELPGEKRLHEFIEAAKALPRVLPDRRGL